MKMRIRSAVSAGLLFGPLLCGSMVAAAEPTNRGPEQMAKRAAELRPAADQVRWRQIPWAASLVEAEQMARAERRPIFLWILDDEPFDRC